MAGESGTKTRTKTSHSSYITPEDVETDKWYAITLNPCNKFQFYKLKNTSRFSHFKASMVTLLKKHFTFPYRFYVEMSSKGRLHLHGRVKFDTLGQSLDLYNFFMRIEDLNLCTYMFSNLKESLSVDKKKQYKDWATYSKKQFKYWEKLGCNSCILYSVEYNIDSRYDITKYFD